MSTPCEKLVRDSLPIFRALVAKKLIEKYKLSQVDVAEKLGITQAAVSQYIYSKRGGGRKNKNGNENMTIVEEAADKMAKDIYKGKVSKDALLPAICDICNLIKMKDFE